MFFENRLIISYIYEANPQRYLFQLTGGEEKVVTQEEFFGHLETYRHYEARQAIKYEHEYRPLPVTVSIQHKIDVYPINRKEHKRFHKNTFVPLQRSETNLEEAYPPETRVAVNMVLNGQQVNYSI